MGKLFSVRLLLVLLLCYVYLHLFNYLILILLFKYVQYRSRVSWQSRLETRFPILEVFENRESSFEAWVSIFEDQESSFEFRWSSFEFQDTQRIFWGSRTEISRKRFNFQNRNNSDEQNNWRGASFIHANPLLNVCKYFRVYVVGSGVGLGLW